MTSAKSLKRRAHNDAWWADHPERTRCTAHYKSTGERCRVDVTGTGATVCAQHGALAPHVLAAAATRIQMNVDLAATRLIEWLNDPNVDMRERVKIAHDLLDRGGLQATQKHLVGVVANDPVEQLFQDLLTTPGMFDPPTSTPKELDYGQAAYDEAHEPSWESAIAALPGADDVVDAELVEEPAPKRTPAEIARAHDAKRGRSKHGANPPKHIAEGVARLAREGLW